MIYSFNRFFYLISKEMDEEVLRMQTDEIVSRARLLDNEIKVKIFLSFYDVHSIGSAKSADCSFTIKIL